MQEEGCRQWRVGPIHPPHPTSGVLALVPGLFFPFACKAVSEGSGLERSEAPSARFLINVFQQGSPKVEGATPLKAIRAGASERER